MCVYGQEHGGCKPARTRKSVHVYNNTKRGRERGDREGERGKSRGVERARERERERESERERGSTLVRPRLVSVMHNLVATVHVYKSHPAVSSSRYVVINILDLQNPITDNIKTSIPLREQSPPKLLCNDKLKYAQTVFPRVCENK